MGIVHTTQYLDFPSESWKILSNNPTNFAALNDNLTLNIRDVSHREHKLVFKKGGRIEYICSVGKYRLKCDDIDLIN